MATTVVKSALQAIRERGLRSFLRDLKEDGFTKCIFDGNLLQTKIHNVGATVGGVDKFGNKYYEKLGDTQSVQIKVMLLQVVAVEVGDLLLIKVPPEHGWLQCITDHTGDELLMLKPKRYGLSTRKTYLERGVNLSTILKDMHLILVRESGLGINHGNPRNLSNLPKPIFFFFSLLCKHFFFYERYFYSSQNNSNYAFICCKTIYLIFHQLKPTWMFQIISLSSDSQIVL